MSSADGTFLLRDVPDGTYRLLVTRPGFRHLDPRQLKIAGTSETGLELQLAELPP